MNTRFVIDLLALPTILFAGAMMCDTANGQTADTVLNNGKIYTVNDRQPQAEAVAIKDGKFIRVGSNEDVKHLIADATNVVDLQGMSVLPGIIDTHVHLMSWVAKKGQLATRRFLDDQVRKNLDECLEHGVTTIKSIGDPIDMILAVREDLQTGKRRGPRLLVVGPILTSPGGHPIEFFCKGNPWCRKQSYVELDSDEAARKAVHSLAKEKNVDAIKLFCDDREIKGVKPLTKLKEDIMRSIIDEAHKYGLRATVHAPLEEDAIVAIRSGADGVEHLPKTPLVGNRLANILNEKHAFVVPTLAISEVSSLTTPEMFEQKMANVLLLHKKGVRIAAGSDTAYDLELGSTTIRELELMVEAGLPTDAVIRAATHDAAEHLGLLDKIGTVEEGKMADLIIVDGDPMLQIKALRTVNRVIQSGNTVYTRQ